MVCEFLVLEDISPNSNDLKIGTVAQIDAASSKI